MITHTTIVLLIIFCTCSLGLSVYIKNTSASIPPVSGGEPGKKCEERK